MAVTRAETFPADLASMAEHKSPASEVAFMRRSKAHQLRGLTVKPIESLATSVSLVTVTGCNKYQLLTIIPAL